MRVENLIPDTAPAVQSEAAPPGVFERVLDDLGSVLNGAERAENAFASGRGDLQTAVYERARADVALSVATAAAQRGAQALQSILNMQV
jgi:flagellar hook-basal body complex protein FliE